MNEDRLSKSIDDLSKHLERTHVAEYIQMIQSPAKLMWVNFLMGVSRGFGIAIGMSAIFGIAVYILSRMINIPILGEFIAQIVKIVQENIVK